MNTQSDQQLLQAYAASRSEPAFAELVRRHIDLVYSAALRRIGDPHLAQDVTQGTFAALAQNAQSLTSHPVLSGWLHRTTQNIAANLVRSNIRRQVREQEAVTMNELLFAAPDASWQTIAPHLDAALDGLDVADRDAVMLRYFEKKSASEMAVQLGISDDAAQKRVSRAVERLREFFTKRGVSIGVSGLAVVISTNAVQAAPVGLALTISTVAALAGTTLATTATVTATKALAMTALQKTIVTATIAVLAGVGIYEARQASHMREQNEAIQQRQSPLNAEIRQLNSELADATNRLVALQADIERLNRSGNEVLRLRGEIARLRSETAPTPQTATATNVFLLDRMDPKWRPNWGALSPYDLTKFPDSGTNFLVREAKNVGTATPAALFQTWIYARLTGDTEALLATFDFPAEFTEEEKARVIRGTQTGDGLKTDLEARGYYKLQDLLSLGYSSDRYLALYRSEFGGEPTIMTAIFRKIGDNWKVLTPNYPPGTRP